jgi:alkanesulfonate monooxygenase SsuD/methylene tetrahydromethanopterin reductase-like flavin-dependent oxidoreductase (luciferase family)
MEYGLFTMPSHPPERSLFDGHQWDLQQLRWADELGFSEAWVGEHHTAPWEPHPAPDLLVAQALQQPHPPIGVAGLSKGSDTLKLAGERGFWPLSLNLNPTYVGSHWEAVEQGAARSGRTPKRADWRMVREVFIADTDAEALRLSAGGMMGRMMREYFLPLLAAFGFTEFLKHDPSVPDSDVTPEYCAKHNWLVGSPATVAAKLHAIYEEVGGFGTLLVFCFDYVENAPAWRHSMELLATEVMPQFRSLVPQ